MSARLVAAALVFAAAACSKPKPFLEQRAAHPTQLVAKGPSPQPFDRIKLPPGYSEETYPSGELKLRAWLALPPGDAKVPAVVYFHSGFALRASDLEDARPFLDAGFALLVPTVRGENGNPGDHEQYWSELDDARAAVRFLASNPRVDPARVYTFGHGAGGVLSALLSLCDEPKLRLTGSAGGVFDEQLFAGLQGLPFDRADKTERRLRVFAPNAKVMLQKHVAYVGVQDALSKKGVEVAQQNAPEGMLEVVPLPGDHFTSLDAAVQRYVARLTTP